MVVPVSWVLEPFWRFRVTPINCARLGHLAGNTRMFVAERRLQGAEKRTFRVFFGALPCNRFFFALIEVLNQAFFIREERRMHSSLTHAGVIGPLS